MSNPRSIIIAYSIAVEFRIPDDFPLSAHEIQEIADWKVNDTTDGRQPFSTETMKGAAGAAAYGNMEDAIEHHYNRRVEKSFGSAHGHTEARDRLVERLKARVRPTGWHKDVGVEVRLFEATVTCPGCGYETAAKYKSCVCGSRLPEASADLPFAPQAADPHVVLCRADRAYDGAPPGAYELATRTVFEGRANAEHYAAGISPSREPIVIPLPLAELRTGEDRGHVLSKT